MKKLLSIISMTALVAACSTTPKDVVKDNFAFADKQLRYAFTEIDAAHAADGSTPAEKPSPRNIEDDGSLRMVKARDWTSGFFPGELWYMYEFTGDEYWKDKAIEYTNYLENLKSYKGTHDLGFMVYCSFGNGERLAQVPNYKEIILEASNSLISRFRPTTGCIRSWDHNSDKWQYPVIIDNMMNLEMLFYATKISGDSTFYNIAVTHANTTLKNHFRDDASSFHVIDYDTITGAVRNKHTHQGYAHESAWARGQAWGIYGYTMCYRETGDPAYLAQAEKIANFIFTNPNMPADLVPYWDYNAPDIPNAPRDASAATVTASALYELSTMSAENGAKYKQWADTILENLTSTYRAPENGARGFLLLSSTGHKPNNSEINVPIIYADYYFLEALIRKNRLANGQPVIL